MKITVLMGGWSPEREISLRSAKNIIKILKEAGHSVYAIDIKKDLRYITDELYKSNPDYIFNTLHGTGGEDGVIQGVLDVYGVPYNTSGLLSSAICFDKYICNILAYKAIEDTDVKIIDTYKTKFQDLNNLNKYPAIIKPACNGSSVGIHKINNEEDFKNFKKQNWSYGDILVQDFIPGQDITVLVKDNKAIGGLEITYNTEFYNYKAKYSEGGSKHSADIDIPNSVLKFSENIFKLCECKGIARIDFRYDNKNAYFLEINTQPGMTETSLVPDILKNKKLSIFDIIC